jgi:7-carboxy-7-deazaguanine synthase
MTHYMRVQPLRDYSKLQYVPGNSQFAVAEQFFSVQGEGHWTGTPAWFIRLQGCTVGCPWCDTKHTWEAATATSALADIVRGVPQSARHVVVTGGEPYEQDIHRLLYALHIEGRRVQVETSGCFDVYGPGWITVSPKFVKPLSRKALRAANEIKQVITCEDDIRRFQEEVLPHVGQWIPISLQPVSNGRRAVEICIEECKRSGYQLSLQTHKLAGLR